MFAIVTRPVANFPFGQSDFLALFEAVVAKSAVADEQLQQQRLPPQGKPPSSASASAGGKGEQDEAPLQDGRGGDQDQSTSGQPGPTTDNHQGQGPGQRGPVTSFAQALTQPPQVTARGKKQEQEQGDTGWNKNDGGLIEAEVRNSSYGLGGACHV